MLEKKIIEQLLNSASKDKWKRIGLQKRTGVTAALFSVYSKNSIGIGDLDDLKLLIDWANKTGNSVIQLLPMNEIGAIHCPYDAISSFALEPVYLSLGKLAAFNKFKAKIGDLRKRFPVGKAHVDYGIKKEKLSLLWEIFCADDNRDSKEYKQFITQNSYWLNDFALFKTIKDDQDGKAWYEWEDKYKNREPACLMSFRQEHEEKIIFQQWMQWLAFKQFKDVKKYAQGQKVLLKGDLPFLISRDSADVWAHPDFFKLDYAAGAPPDMYCAKGQRWGMPTYSWEKISSDGYRYLKEKLRYAENFYDMLRIDHVVGLSRIWSIPYHEPLENQGLNGFFDPKDESKWLEHGRNILTVMLNNTNMLLCAEDLGVIPEVCTDTLKELGIPGNDVQRWVKDWKTKHDFLAPRDYRGLSVAMLSTHDTTNWPAWWENEAGTVDEGLFIRKCSDHRQINFSYVKGKLFDLAHSGHGRLRWLNSVDSVDKLVSILGKKKEELIDFIDFYVNTFREKEKLWKHLGLKGIMRKKSDKDIVQQALKISLATKAIFCINTIIDWLYLTDIFKGDPYQYRVNTPGTISENNWSLTIPISLDDLLKHKVCGVIRNMVFSSGRI